MRSFVGAGDTVSRALAAVMIMTSLLAAGLDARGARALHQRALERIGEQIASHRFRLLVNLHEPDPRADSMQAATLERRGWHHHNPQRPIALPAGATVEVTGVFNYAERGFFVEVTGATPEGDHPEEARARIRFRIMVEADGTDAQAQQAEAIDLLRRVLEPLPEP